MGAPTKAQLLAHTAKHIGIAENPLGSNKTEFGVQCGMNGVAWCAIFQSCMALDLGAVTALMGAKRAYTPTMGKWFYDRGQWFETPRAGDYVFFAWGTGTGRWKGIQHVGIVESVNADGTFYTIEGNVDSRVKRIKRSMTYVAGFGRPAYADVPAPLPTPDTTPLLKNGDSGPAVKRMQERLLVHGFKLPQFGADGDFGDETEKAVIAFQTARKLEVDGICGDQTWGALNAAPPVVAPPAPAPAPVANARVREFQYWSRKAGMRDYTGALLEVDGVYGERTASVTRKPAVLVRGARGNMVAFMQRCVGAKDDGYYGLKPYRETYDKVIAFQKAHKLAADGVVGENTWKRLLLG